MIKINANQLKEYIKENEKTIELLENLGCRNPRYIGSEIRAGRPDSSNDTGIVIRDNMSGSIYTSNKSVNGDIITIFMELRNKSFLDTLKWLHKRLGLDFTFKIKEEEERINPLDIFIRAKQSSKKRYTELKFLDESILNRFYDVYHIDMIKEGFSPLIMNYFGIMYDEYNQRIIFPYRYWSNGRLIGYTGRTLIEEYELLGIPKYHISKNCPKTLNLYGLWENYKLIQEKGYVIVVEGEKGVLMLTQWGYPAVALSGWDISDEQVKILIGLNVDIIIALDKDIEESTLKELADKFNHIRNCSYLLDEKDLLDKKDSPYDKGKEVFERLFNEYRKSC